MSLGHQPTATWSALQQRARVLRDVRSFFDARGYVEVETPVLSGDIVVDTHLEPFVVPTPDRTLFLQTSPEFAMKRLLAAGAGSIYQITRAFRQQEIGELHNPEFSILEWYGVGDNYHTQMDLVEELVRSVQGHDPDSRFERLTYDGAFEQALGTRVIGCPAGTLRDLAREHRVDVPESIGHDDVDALLNLLLAECVEPELGHEVPVFLYDYPASQAALARVREATPPVAERFELYMGGIELCNGYQELTDPTELRRRNREQNAQRRAEGRADLPEESRLLAAMEAGLPECSGVALGVDRLVMLATGHTQLSAVMPFPFDRA